MTEIDTKIDASTDYQCPDYSAFLNWDYKRFDSEHERTVVFQSLVATVKMQAALDDSLEVKAEILLKSVVPSTHEAADGFLSNFGQTTDESLTNFVPCIVVLISSPSKAISAAAMKILHSLIWTRSENVRLDLFKADLLPQLINTLNPLSLSFSEAVDIHTCLMTSVRDTIWLATPESLARLEIEDENEQQAVHKTVYQQVLAPSEIMEQLSGHESSKTGIETDENQRPSRTVSDFFWTTNTVSFSAEQGIIPPSMVPFLHQLILQKTIRKDRKISRHQHPPSPLCLFLTTPSVARAICGSFEAHAMLASTVFLLRFLQLVVDFFTVPSSLHVAIHSFLPKYTDELHD
ncbi:hypothetical protein BLNAU_7531 [Blattamonas nauphoetae]|uniref:Uncharacterized protein n=1 Tax=Blattamonas nauphoetae TaxID=2049346 RepID=A0ABQ9Y1M5_9EUKA|nr:hypothetical protein BLNAU_7531 [Blattamonas nauphoetae]